MIFYEAYAGHVDTLNFATLAEAHAWCRDETASEPIFRPDCQIRQFNLALDKETILLLLNQKGGTHEYTGKEWTLTRRGGLKPVEPKQ